jgi:hypothetical protein
MLAIMQALEPTASAAWTATTVNALRAGLVNDASSQQLDASYLAVMVDYTPTTGAPPTVNISANPTSIVAQTTQTSLLSWTSVSSTGSPLSATLNVDNTGANSVPAQNPSGTVEQPTSVGTHNYVLAVTDTNGTTTKMATITVAALPAATVNSFGTATTIMQGQSALLTWTTANADSSVPSGVVTLDGQTVVANGSTPVTPSSTHSYTLVATNASGTDSKQVTITVIIPQPPPPPVMGGPGSVLLVGNRVVMTPGGQVVL